MSKYAVSIGFVKKGNVTYFVSAKNEEDAKMKIIKDEYDDYEYDYMSDETEHDWNTAEFEAAEKVK